MCLENAIILDGDQIICNPGILQTDFVRSGYSSVWINDKTSEWLQEVENGVVTSCYRNGGVKGWQLYGVSRWNKRDAEKLKYYIEMEFEINKQYNLYWDDVAMFCHPKEFKLCVYPIKKNDVIEIDNLNELIDIDGNYKKYL